MENNPDNQKRIISVPIFKKMMSREKLFDTNKCLADYMPNYDAIYSNAYKYISNNEELKKKKNLLRKILFSSRPPSQYILLPSLNKSMT